MKKTLLTLILLLSLCTAYGQTQLSTAELATLFQLQERKWVSLHDPSVVWNPSDQHFYIYGSHYTAVQTRDFSSYTPIPNYYQNHYTSAEAYRAFRSNPVRTVRRTLPGQSEPTEVEYPSFDASAYASIYSTSGMASWISGNQWAPDVVYNPHMKKWCQYLSLNGDHWASVVVLLTSDSPKGPFVYQGPVVFSGFDGQTRTIAGAKKSVDYKDTDLEIVLGPQSSLPSRYKTSEWGNLWPNCIDPCSFFDQEGNLWLAYGSWSGGIFLLRLDPSTGLRDYTVTYSPSTYSGRSPGGKTYTGYLSDPYFGKLIAGGSYSSGEGPYIQYIGSHYYLFMSYGGFSPDGGYEMRVFRSEKPDGPYVDAAGNSPLFSRYQLNYGPHATTDRGVKLLGAMNHWGLMSVGECAQGHNSVCQDDQGRTFLVCHAKFNNGTAGHQLRVYQLYLNQHGWPCAAPFQYNGETTTDATLAASAPWSESDIEGDYHLLVHPYRLDHEQMQEATPVRVHLSADGHISGHYNGTWKYTSPSHSHIQITLGSTTYSGVLVPQTLEGSNALTLCFTALCSSTGSHSGEPCWGYKILQPQCAIAYNYHSHAATHFKSGLYRAISSNLDIQFSPTDNVCLTWTSSRPDLFTSTGKYTPPTERTPFTLTARMESGDYWWQEDYNAVALPVPSLPGDQTTGLVAYYDFDTDPSDNLLASDQRATLARSSTTAALPTFDTDPSRFGHVLHQYFGEKGRNSYTRIPNPLAGLSDLDGFTVSLWVRRADPDNVYDALWSFFGSTTPTASGPRLYLTGNSYVGFNDDKGNWFDINHPETKQVDRIKAGEWHLVTLTFSKARGCTLYLDGAKYPSSLMGYAGSTSADTFDRDLVLSFVASARYFLFGLGSFWGSAEASFDDLLIYRRELTADDVRGLHTLLNRNNPFNSGTIVSIPLPLLPASPVPSAGSSVPHDLLGRPVTSPVRGIYIENGRKILRK